MTAAPCLACPERRIVTSDPAVCSKWAAYQEIHAAELAAQPSPAEEWIMRGYIKDHRRRYLRNTFEKRRK